MARWLFCLAILASCYQPTLHEGAPCGPGATCPTGQECRAGTCFFTDTPADGAVSHPDGDLIDASMIAAADAPPDGPPYVAWGTPIENLSLELPQTGEDDPSVTTDKLTVVIDATQVAGDTDLFIGTRPDLATDFTVTALTNLNSTSDESSPEISGDGNTIYFTSTRSATEHVYVSTYSPIGGWAAPTLVTELSIGSNSDLAISPDGLTAAVMRSHTVYIHTRASTSVAWGTGTAHNELSITTDISAPTITNGGQTLYLHAGATRDIYVSHKVGSTYQTPVPVTELNTSGRDAAPFVNQADNYMIFERDGDIYETTR